MKLAVTIDVEEEGLFSGNYARGNAPTTNISKLALLDPLFSAWRIRPTLFVSYQASRSIDNQKIIMELKEKWKGEIGAHLHPWNTPPENPSSCPEPVPSEFMSKELLYAKMDTLIGALRSMGASPASFRMGRFDLNPRVLGVLEDMGIKVDSSIAPSRCEYGGISYLTAPTDPYYPHPDKTSKPGTSSILEVPVTILPLSPKLNGFLELVGKRGHIPQNWISWFSKYLGSLTVQPVGVGIRRLKAAVKIHRHRGGKVLTVFFHSSELAPGISPYHPSEMHVKAFLERLRNFFFWLNKEIAVEPLTLSELCALYKEL